MSLEEEKNKALARRLLEVLFANGDLDTLDEVLAPTLSTAACYLVSCGAGRRPLRRSLQPGYLAGGLRPG